MLLDDLPDRRSAFLALRLVALLALELEVARTLGSLGTLRGRPGRRPAGRCAAVDLRPALLVLLPVTVALHIVLGLFRLLLAAEAGSQQLVAQGHAHRGVLDRLAEAGNLTRAALAEAATPAADTSPSRPAARVIAVSAYGSRRGFRRSIWT